MSTLREDQLLAENNSLKRKLKICQTRYCGCGDPLFFTPDQDTFGLEIQSLFVIVVCDVDALAVGGSSFVVNSMGDLLTSLNATPSIKILGNFSINPSDGAQIQFLPAPYITAGCAGILSFTIFIGVI